ncbi:GDP-mannose 4,6-dehydratase [Haladaptatus pallidirubidus]|uniref:GDP-mannose 4,6-dehydratase n=1 Tax=Haladaptatus pallidirubidus TaxID=1008152 RepID=A0AAV3UPW8_9EURY|nr:GDP-mannose 4,6-dehydratase [Haladaptatus pallidirubidus]
MGNRALITGITGQDGSYLAEHLLNENYEVYGLARWTSTSNEDRIEHVSDNIHIITGDLTDQTSLDRAIETADPDEVYHLGALSFVPESFTQPITTADVTGLGTTRMLEAIRRYNPDIRFYQAGTSEMFGNAPDERQSIDTRFYPRSPYGVSKLYAYWMTINYREAHDMYATNGILFNHESPRRGKQFVTRKITRAAARIALDKQDELRLGNLDAKRDWGHARDYVKAMHLMLQQDDPDDYVVGTGEHHTVRECARIAFDEVGLDWQEFVTIDEKYFRATEVDALKADPSRAKQKLKWEPKISFEEMIREMVQKDLADLQSNE